MSETKIRIPTVAIVGRPNVGKSSLFNAIIGRRLSIVHEMSGVTRDRIMSPASWHGKHFQLVDTGGLGTMDGEKRGVDIWDERIGEQVAAAIEDADVLVMICNVQDGVVSLDKEVAGSIRASGIKIILAVNKCDDAKSENQAVEFSSLGFEQIVPISCLHRRNIGVLLDQALAEIPQVEISELEDEPFRIAVVGRPNSGKSSLVNALLGENRVIVSDAAGTTRDSIDIDFQLEYRGEQIPAALIDTAGLRKRAKVHDAVEMFSAIRVKEAVERARLALFLIEASPDGTTAQDRRIAKMIEESGKACVIVANKFDICPEKSKEQLLKEVRYSTPGMKYAPVVFFSALTKYNMDGLFDQVAQVMEQMEVRISTSMVNRVLSDAIERISPPVIGRAPFKMYYASMVSTEPPRFILFVNDPKLCAANYLGYLNNALRLAFDFTGLPIIIELRERPKKVESIRTRAPRKTRPKPTKEAGKPKSKSKTSGKNKPRSKPLSRKQSSRPASNKSKRPRHR